MARNKHSAALFEVIGKSRSATPGSSPGVFSSITGLFRPRAVSDAPPPARPPQPFPSPSPESADPAAKPGVALDSARREVAFRMTYTSAIITVLAIGTVVGAAFLAGQRAQPTHPAISESTTAIQKTAPNKNVVKVPGPTGFDNLPPGEPDIKSAGGKGPIPVTDGIVRGKKRQEGMNYVVIQLYPEEKMALEARKLLDENGLETTIERNLPGWTPAGATWYAVVGTWGFPRHLSSSAEYNAYLAKIKEISDTRMKKGSFKAFDPRPYKWAVKDAK